MSYILIIIILLISGCSLLTPPMERPVIEEKLNSGIFDKSAVGTLSLTPDRRVVLVNFENNRFCAEAPTEVGQDISKLIKAAVDAQSGTGQKIGLGAVVAANYSNSVLNKRTQGVQLFQANSYFMCQMYMNGAIKGEQLLRMQIELLNAVGPLIAKELPILYKQEKAASIEFNALDFEKIIGTNPEVPEK